MKKARHSLLAALSVSILMLGIGIYFSPKAQAANEKTIRLLSPTTTQSYGIGSKLTVAFEAEGFEPTNQQPITVTLIERTTRKRVRIGFVTRPTADGLYEIDWEIPTDFFERKKLDILTARFKVIVWTVQDGTPIRKYGKKSVVTIPKIKAPTTTVMTTATVPDEDPLKAQLIDLSNKILASSYEFRAGPEPWEIRRLTVVNDSENDGFEADPNEDPGVVANIYIRYPDKDGNLQTKKAPFNGGKSTLSGLNFYIPDRDVANLQIFVDPLDLSQFGDSLSGRTYKIGLQTTGNTTSSFEAVGQFSGSTDNNLAFQVTANDVEEFVARKAGPIFRVLSPSQRELTNGENDAFEFSIAADHTISVARLVFNVTQAGLDRVDEVRMFRNGSLLSAGDETALGKVYLRWNPVGNSCFASSQQAGVGTGMGCNGNVVGSSQLILTFTQEEIIRSGQTNTYKLRFNVGGAGLKDKLTVKLTDEDDNTKPSIGGIVGTTGQIYNNGGGNELFDTADYFVGRADAAPGRNIIWSDWSADFHRYPNFTPATNPTIDGTSSTDWTNGYLVQVNELPTVFSIR